ncbi:MAG: SDR family oxidoreductase [Planctomycetes bacterium]|nr:SDR family oxidoreductase [Planctomycetota bacterium]
MRTILVTGGAGFIGSHLVDHLVTGEDRIRVLDDLTTGNTGNLAGVAGRIDLIEGSVTDRSAVEKAVRGCDVVFHLAALPSVAQSVADPLRSHEISATGTLNVLNAARLEKARRVVYAASSSAYGDQPGDVRRETDLLLPLSPYAAAKLAGEHYCRCFHEAYGLETVCLRFFNVFGPRQDPKSPYSGVIPLFINAMRQGKRPTIFGDGLQSRDFVYVADVVQALTRAAAAPSAAGNVYNVGTGQSITILDLVTALNAILGLQMQPILAPPRAGDVRHSRSDITLARKELGFDPTVSIEEGLRRTVDMA